MYLFGFNPDDLWLSGFFICIHLNIVIKHLYSHIQVNAIIFSTYLDSHLFCQILYGMVKIITGENLNAKLWE